eukprot:GFKZ01005271.1.p1 GENE.GFKZ01005271.1~~GFKZ01005271.1.p1  ORF type:complete len:708 (+),score=117.92 GFKZ01005271.1:3329-5452(+)
MSTALHPSVRRKALRTFRQRGVIVHAGSLERLFLAYENLPEADFSQFLDSVFALLSNEDASASGILTLSVAEKIAERLQRDARRQQGVASATLEIIDTFTVPAWKPHAEGRNVFSGKRVVAPPRPVIAGSPSCKADMFRARYEFLKAKTLRNPRFRPPASQVLSLGEKSPYYQLTGVESLAGCHDERLVLGMLTQLEEGTWFLEDLNGNVRVDLSKALVTAGLHTECSFVIAQGKLIDADGEEPIFRVSIMGTPPCESRHDSLDALSKGPSLFGGHFEQADGPALLKMEREAVDSVFLILSDVALDNSNVFAGLRHIFRGYLEDEVLPKMVALMGNFLSHPFGQQVDDVMVLSEKFTELGKMIATEFPQMAEECMFVIIPGMNDPGPGNVLPRPPIPRYVLKGFIEALGEDHVHLGTNPCRVRYMTQEIVLLRDDLIQKMVRHCAVKPEFAESGKMSEHFLKSIADQGHLCPLPNTARPILWRHAHAMWLFPLPHTIVVADKVDGYICRYEGVLGLNPGSFATDFSFQVYLPAERRAQQCNLSSEDLEGSRDENIIGGASDMEEDVGEREEGLKETAMSEGEREDSAIDMDCVPKTKNGRKVVAHDSDIDMSMADSDLDSLPPGRQPQSQRIADSDRTLQDAETEPPCREGLFSTDSDPERGRDCADDEDSEGSESDADSVVAPDGVEKRDIRALVRQSMANTDASA